MREVARCEREAPTSCVRKERGGILASQKLSVEHAIAWQRVGHVGRPRSSVCSDERRATLFVLAAHAWTRSIVLSPFLFCLRPGHEG